MSTAQHWISNYNGSSILFGFLELQGALIPSRQQMERMVRPGTNGIGIIYTGNRGEPFQIQTRVDAVDQVAAENLFKAYNLTVGLKKDLYYARRKWGTVLIGNVVMIDIQQTGTIVGGLNVASSSYGAILTASWTLETLYAS